ncbi:MAG: phosphoesterase, partial [Pyrinomonadaceae bacterium]|nr:phosphoesterase [Pyrinomonadaceae bacterium]
LEENRRLARRVRALEEITARVEAEELIAAAQFIGAARLVVHALEGRDADSLKRLALALIERPSTIALLGSHDGETARIVFARAADAPGDMNALMREACALLGGRGGGRPDMAQGGGPQIERFADALDIAARRVALPTQR